MLGDFTGFTFNGVHSSTLGLVRISNGSRYEESLVPGSKDMTEENPGGDGEFFYGSQHQKRTFTVDCAFDGITEMNIRQIRKLLGDKKIHKLIFDEMPYKAYHVKVNNEPIMKSICFNEPDGSRVYRGELTINFVAYFPYALVVEKNLDNYSEGDYPTKDEWMLGSGLLASFEEKEIDIPSSSPDYKTITFGIYNPGDIESGYKLTFDKDAFLSPDENNLVTLEYTITLYDPIEEEANGQFSLNLPCPVSGSSTEEWSFANIAAGAAGHIEIDIDKKTIVFIFGKGTSHEVRIPLMGVLNEGELTKIPCYQDRIQILSILSNQIIGTTVDGVTTQDIELDYTYYYY